MQHFWSKLRRDYFAQAYFLMLFVLLQAGIFAPFFANFDPTKTDILHKFEPISTTYWLGTDQLGRDIFSRLIFAIRSTVFYALFAMLATVLIGTLVGVIAGFFGKKVDEFLMRLCDVMLSFPSEIMILALVGVLGTGIDHLLLAVVLVKWAWYARMIRSTIMQYTHKNYVRYAQTVALPNTHIVKRHLLPVALAEIIVLASADMGGIVLLISGLSFIGLGVQAPIPEWGAMLSDAKEFMLLYPEQMLPPGIAIVLTVVAFNGVGDFLRDVFDPDGK